MWNVFFECVCVGCVFWVVCAWCVCGVSVGIGVCAFLLCMCVVFVWWMCVWGIYVCGCVVSVV